MLNYFLFYYCYCHGVFFKSIDSDNQLILSNGNVKAAGNVPAVSGA